MTTSRVKAFWSHFLAYLQWIIDRNEKKNHIKKGLWSYYELSLTHLSIWFQNQDSYCLFQFYSTHMWSHSICFICSVLIRIQQYQYVETGKQKTKTPIVLPTFHSSQTFFQNTQFYWRWLDPNSKFKKLKLTSEVMIAIHIPKPGKHHHFMTLFVISAFWMLSKHKDCMSSLVTLKDKQLLKTSTSYDN